MFVMDITKYKSVYEQNTLSWKFGWDVFSAIQAEASSPMNYAELLILATSKP